ncbi:MAG: hypothetical protein F4Y39_16475 [Gemmatimonadetes bacterium]|nr:hypothetical protein [Gemmatimonadota bacterium]
MQFALRSLVLLLFSGLIFWHSVSNPQYNWDMIGYVASAFSYEIDDAGQLQRTVYTLLKQTVPEEAYKDLTHGRHRHARAYDPESLKQHLPFYQIRIVYVLTIYVSYKLGLNPFIASYLISAISIIIALWVLAFLFPLNVSLIYLITIPVTGLIFDFHNLSNLSTPDALAVLIVFISYSLLLRQRKELLLVLPLSVLIRTDLLILVGVFYVYLFIFKDWEKKYILLSALLGIIGYCWVNWQFDNYGWSTVFHYTFIKRQTHPGQQAIVVDLNTYYQILKRNIFKYHPKFFLFFVSYLVAIAWSIALIMKHIKTFNERPNDIMLDLLFLVSSSVIYVLMHYFLFPAPWLRFFAGNYVLAYCMLCFLLLRVKTSR